MLKIFSETLWAILPIIIAAILYDFRQRQNSMQLLQVIVLKADSLVSWIEVEFPDLDWSDKIDKVIEILKEELILLGFAIPSDVVLRREVLASYKCRQDNLSALNGDYAETISEASEEV
jgi:hypothetical protein